MPSFFPRGSSCRGRVVFSLFFIASLGLCVGAFRKKDDLIPPLPRYGDQTAWSIGTTEWRPTGVACLPPPESFSSLGQRGSWVGEPNRDAFVGDYTTGWYQAPSSSVALLVCGYPTLDGNRLEVEAHDVAGKVSVIAFQGADPRESWTTWLLMLPPDTARFRIHARDGSSRVCGWLGFSEPFTDLTGQSYSPRMIMETFGSVALALLLIFGPGVAWQTWRRSSFLDVLWPGPLILGLGGGVCWAAGGIVKPSLIALIWVPGVLLALGITAWRIRPWRQWTRVECGALGLAALIVLGAAGKAAFSGGPEGELYHGTISRTLEIGDRSDSRISFHNVQLVAHHLGPYSDRAHEYFAPDSFSHRGPLAGLIAAPVVLATGGRPPLAKPDDAWEPFDSGGIATYRIVLATLAASALVAVASLLTSVSGASLAGIGTGFVALAPFFWHEVYFSWPKMAAAAWTIGAFGLVLRGRPFAAGLALAGAYLYHPLAALSAPFLGLWLLLSNSGNWKHRCRNVAWWSAGAALVIAVWMIGNHGHFHQNGFLIYFQTADGGTATFSSWFQSRWESFADTFIPFYVWIVHADHPAFNAIGLHSDRITQFCLQAWTTLPFAVGLLAWIILLPSFIIGVARRPAVALLTLIGPALLILAYWGAAITGIMRECGHVFFLSGWIFLLWSAGDRIPAWTKSWTFPTLRAAGILAMMFMPALLANNADPAWRINDVFWIVVTSGAMGGVVFITHRLADQA